MALRPEFREALLLLATATERLVAKGFGAPILVGGAAVELYTGGAITSGDFDFVSPWHVEFLAELKAVGFERPDIVGWLDRSLLHPQLDLAVQVVSGPLMSGNADVGRINVLEIEDSGDRRPLSLKVIPVEDLIADRLGQAFSGSRLDKSMKNQAIRLYQFAEDIDKAYLDRRIRTETDNAASLATLVSWVETCGSP